MPDELEDEASSMGLYDEWYPDGEALDELLDEIAEFVPDAPDAGRELAEHVITRTERLAALLIVVAFASWAFLPARHLPGNRAPPAHPAAPARTATAARWEHSANPRAGPRPRQSASGTFQP
jgi:hypothetical protein